MQQAVTILPTTAHLTVANQIGLASANTSHRRTINKLRSQRKIKWFLLKNESCIVPRLLNVCFCCIARYLPQEIFTRGDSFRKCACSFSDIHECVGCSDQLSLLQFAVKLSRYWCVDQVVCKKHDVREVNRSIHRILHVIAGCCCTFRTFSDVSSKILIWGVTAMVVSTGLTGVAGAWENKSALDIRKQKVPHQQFSRIDIPPSIYWRYFLLFGV